MQLILEIKEKDLQVLLPLLERLKITYKQLSPKLNDTADKKQTPSKFSEKYAGKLSSEVGEALQQYISKSRKEWDRNI